MYSICDFKVTLKLEVEKKMRKSKQNFKYHLKMFPIRIFDFHPKSMIQLRTFARYLAKKDAANSW